MMVTTKINGKDVELLLFPMKNLKISQGGDGQYSHQAVNALDLCGKDAGAEPTYAPCTMTYKWHDSYTNGNAIFYQSVNPVLFVDGTVDYATMMFIHDNSIADQLALVNKGYTFKQGEEFGDEGTAGYATGNHCHFEIAKGKYTVPYAKNSRGVYHLPNSMRADKAVFLGDDVTVYNGGQPTASGYAMSWTTTKEYFEKPSDKLKWTTTDQTAVYRLISTVTNEHLFTTDKNERIYLVNTRQWKDEGLAWIAPKKSDKPVYRLNNGKHKFSYGNESGWTNEGIKFYDGTGVPVYELYNQKTKDWVYTTNTNEQKTLVKGGWILKGNFNAHR